MRLGDLRVGYAPMTEDFSAPGDRRRFAGWAARRGVRVEVADPGQPYDAVVVTQGADLSIWRRPRPDAGKVVFDLTDSYLAIPPFDMKGLLRGAAKFVVRQTRYPVLNYWAALRGMCLRADAVVCVTDEQRASVLSECGNTHVILDLQEADVLAVKSDYRAGTPFALVWEGLGGNVTTLATLGPVVRELRRRHEVIVRIVTNPVFPSVLRRYVPRDALAIARGFLGDGVELVPWSAQNLAAVATAGDLAVIPIPLDDMLRYGKPENKLLVFWRLGLPVVTTATPAYGRAMRACGVPLLCRTEAEWVETLERCIGDEDLRRRAALAGQAWARKEHSDEHILERWDAVFYSLFPGLALT